MSDDKPPKLDYASPANQEPSIWRRDIIDYMLPKRRGLRVLVLIVLVFGAGALWTWILRLAWLVLFGDT
jgi:hypothetical protein